MSKLSRLTLCLLSIVMVSTPLFDILSNIMDLNRINVISIVILLIILISLLVCSALWLYIEWRDFSEEEQLHRERLKYTSPDLLGEQTKVCLGLHNSSSLYKITNGYQTTPYDSIKQRNYLKINHLGQKEKERQIVGDNGMV